MLRREMTPSFFASNITFVKDYAERKVIKVVACMIMVWNCKPHFSGFLKRLAIILFSLKYVFFFAIFNFLENFLVSLDLSNMAILCRQKPY